MRRNVILSCLLLALFTCGIVYAQGKPAKMPREDVVMAPAIGEGLCVSNVFQANMVIQRDKPVNVWGWASPGEKVTVSFAGQTVRTTAKANRSWQVALKEIFVLSSPFVPEPVHYRHAWARNSLTNLTNRKGIPIATQRSDDWLLEETSVKVKDFEKKNSRQISVELRKMLKNADIERRFKEAQATVAELKPLVEKAKASEKKVNKYQERN